MFGRCVAEKLDWVDSSSETLEFFVGFGSLRGVLGRPEGCSKAKPLLGRSWVLRPWPARVGALLGRPWRLLAGLERLSERSWRRLGRIWPKS